MNNTDVPIGQITVVDDKPENLDLLANLLEDVGYEVSPFPQGKIALDGIAYDPPDLILLDIQMPDMNGYEVCQHLKSNETTRNIPVIFVSAFNETFDKVKAFEVGGVDYISKPFQAEEVLARVATHLEMFQIKRKLEAVNVLQAEELAAKNIQLVQLNQSLEEANLDLQSNFKVLQDTQLKLVQTEKMAALGNLVAGIAHEINNPVGFINGNINSAVEHLEDLLAVLDLYQENSVISDVISAEIDEFDVEFIREDFPKLIGSIQSGVQRILEISKALRIFSRRDTDEKTNLNIIEGIDSTLLILKYRLQANEQRPDIQIIKNYGKIPEIKCYPGQINQVFMNLLANAIDALDESNEGKTFAQIEKQPNCITITTEMSADKQSVIVRIADNGIGMSTEVQDKIFEQGFTTKEVGKGTGLGMAIARQIVEGKHGGTLRCHSQFGESTEFAIVLPLEN